MTWVRIDDGAVHHEKLLAAGPDAVTLWLAGLCYANRHTTDGALARGTLLALYPSETLTPKRAKAAAARLVELKLWEETPEGWAIRNYERYQREAMSETRDRRRTADKDAKREKRSPKSASDPPPVGALSESDTPPTSSRSESEPRPVQTVSAPSRARDPVPARPVPSEGESRTPFGEALARLWIGWAKAFERHRGGPPGHDAPEAEREVCRVILETAEARGVDFEALVEATISRYWRDPWPRDPKNRAGMKNLLGSLSTLLASSEASDPASYDPARDGAPTDPRNFAAWNRHIDRLGGLDA